MQKINQNHFKNIALATSYLASVVSDNLFIKSSLQSAAVNILKLKVETKEEIAEALDTLKLTMSIVDLGAVDNSISQMNASVFNKGINNFINILEESQSEEGEKQDKISGIISGYFIENKIENIDFKNTDLSKKLEEAINQKAKDRATESVEEVKELDEKIEENNQEATQEVIVQEPELPTTDQDIRKIKILKILQKSASNLSEISINFTDITIKTVQRDLLDLMRERKIIRLGERRWAKYYLK